MQLSWNARLLLAIAVVSVFTTPSSAQFPALGRMPNSMVYIKAEGKEDVYVDMPGHFDLGSPSISPDGKSVAFDALSATQTPTRESWVVGTDGKGLHKLADGGIPRWAPDKKRIMICRDVSQSPFGSGASERNLIEIELATGTERTLCNGRYGDWSPDGSRLVFARRGGELGNSGVHPGSTIFIGKADGSDAKEYGEGDWPSWSPDGKKIAFLITREGKATLYLLDLETKKRKEIGHGFYRAQWASDGRSFFANALDENGLNVEFGKHPARFWLDKPNKPEFILKDRDHPLSPCVSRDGKTIAVIVDSSEHKEPADASKETDKK